MANQVGELYVSLQVDIEALQQGFTQAQLFSQGAASKMQTEWASATAGIAKQIAMAATAAAKAAVSYSNMGAGAKTAGTAQQNLANSLQQGTSQIGKTKQQTEQLTNAERILRTTTKALTPEFAKQASASRTVSSAMNTGEQQAGRYAKSIHGIGTAADKTDLGRLADGIEELTEVGADLAIEFQSIPFMLSIANLSMSEYAATAQETTNSSSKLADGFGNFSSSIMNTAAGIQTFVGWLGEMGVVAETAIEGIKAFSTGLNTALGIVGFVISGITLLADLFSSLSQKTETVGERFEQLEEKTMNIPGSFQSYYREAKKITDVNLPQNLDDTATAAEKLASKMDDAEGKTGDFRTAIGDFILSSGDGEEAFGRIGDSILGIKDSLIEAKKEAATFQIWQLIQSGLPPEEIAQQIDGIVGGYQAFTTTVGESFDTVDTYVNKLLEGEGTTVDMVEALQGAGGKLSEVGVNLSQIQGSFGDNVEFLSENFKDMEVNEEAYRSGVAQTAGLLQGQATTAYNQIIDAIKGYNKANTDAAAEKDAVIANLEEEKKGYEEKEKLIKKMQSSVAEGIAATEVYTTEELKILEEAAGRKLDLNKLTADEMQEIYESNNKNLEDKTKEYNDAVESRDEELKNIRIRNMQSLQSEIGTITKGLSLDQIEEFEYMAKQSGFKLDEGFMNMVKSAATMGDDLTNAMDFGSTEAAEAFLGSFVDETIAGLGDTVTEVDGSSKEITDTINRINGNLDEIKIKFDKNIDLPHIFITGTLDLETGQVPSVKVNWYDKGGYFNKAAIIGVAEKRPEFVGAAEDLQTFIDRAIKDSIIKVNPAINYVIPDRAFPAANGEVYNDYRTINFDVRPQQMTKEQTDYLVYKLNKELGKKLV